MDRCQTLLSAITHNFFSFGLPLPQVLYQLDFIAFLKWKLLKIVQPFHFVHCSNSTRVLSSWSSTVSAKIRAGDHEEGSRIPSSTLLGLIELTPRSHHLICLAATSYWSHFKEVLNPFSKSSLDDRCLSFLRQSWLHKIKPTYFTVVAQHGVVTKSLLASKWNSISKKWKWL